MKILRVGTGCMVAATITAALLTVPPPAAAESYLNIKAGGYIPTGTAKFEDQGTGIRLSGGGDMDMDAGFNGEVEYGYNFLTGPTILAIDIGLGYFHTSGDKAGILTLGGQSTSYSLSSDVDVVPISLGLVGGIHSGPWRVYGGAGLDVLFCSADADLSARNMGSRHYSSASDTVWGGHVKAGLSYDLTDHVFVGAEAKYLFTGNADFKWTGAAGTDRASADFSGFMVNGLVGFRW